MNYVNHPHKPWYKHRWGVVLAILIWPYLLLWYLWTKSGKSLSFKLASTAAVVVIAIVGIILIAGSTPKTKPVATIKPKVIVVAKTPAKTSQPTTAPKVTTPPAPVLTGFGATQGEWDKTHTEDTRFIADSAYNPEPNSAGGCNGDEYCSMTGTIDYQMSFPNGQAQAETQAIVMHETIP